VTKHVNDFMSDDGLDDDDYVRIARFMAGELTPVERAETERWIAEDAERRSAVASMRSGGIRPAHQLHGTSTPDGIGWLLGSPKLLNRLRFARRGT
jgi:hypothetical protein